jgi:hypothetical protein
VKRFGLALAVAVAAAACTSPPKTEDERTVADRVRGVRYVVPPGWKTYDGEFRSPAGSLASLRVYDLVEADKKFVAGLPDTLMPQLLEWAKWYYVVDGEPMRKATTVAGLPATEFVYPIRVTPRDPPSKVIYWVVTRKTRLFVLRVAFPAPGLVDDEPAVRKVVDGWAFLD